MKERGVDADGRRLLALLRVLIEHNGTIRFDGVSERAEVVGTDGRAVLRLSKPALQKMVTQGFLRADSKGFSATAEGMAWYHRHLPHGLGFRGQHMTIAHTILDEASADRCEVMINLRESPLAWLHTRKGRDGAPLLDDVRFLAGERLRIDVTRAQILPRTTANWDVAIAQGVRANGMEAFSDMRLAAREKVERALSAVGPELSGVLLDVCCFLKGLETVERERHWPARTAKVVLGLALDRLAGHYGLSTGARGPQKTPPVSWRAPDARPKITDPSSGAFPD